MCFLMLIVVGIVTVIVVKVTFLPFAQSFTSSATFAAENLLELPKYLFSDSELPTMRTQSPGYSLRMWQNCSTQLETIERLKL